MDEPDKHGYYKHYFQLLNIAQVLGTSRLFSCAIEPDIHSPKIYNAYVSKLMQIFFPRSGYYIFTLITFSFNQVSH